MKTAEAHNSQLTGKIEFLGKGSPVASTVDNFTLLMKRLRGIALTEPARDAEWLRWVKSKPCCLCDRPAQDAHHIFGSSVSLKSSDYFVVPVCRECHSKVQGLPLGHERVIDLLVAWHEQELEWRKRETE
jgi:hypothetical protein